MKFIQGNKYKLSFTNFFNISFEDSTEFEKIDTEYIDDIKCEICGKVHHKKLYRFHSLTAKHQWYYIGTSCINKINISEG